MSASGPIFLSYNRVDLEFALRFAAGLKNAGVPVWMDRFELRPGCDWRRGVEAGLTASAGLICVLSPDYVGSKYCLDELATVDRHNVKNPTRPKPLFPAVLRTVPDERQPLEIRRLQYVHFYDRDRDWRDENLFDDRLRQLLDGLRTAAGPLVGDPPGREEQYLNGFVAELETRRGVLEFVELTADTRATSGSRPAPADDEFGYSAMLCGPSRSEERVELPTIAAAAARFDRFVLLGEPGAGKTTALRRLARSAAQDRLGCDRIAATPLPLLLYLPQWTTEPTPAAFVRARWQSYGLVGDPIELARIGEVVLYLDGLNEMGADGPRKAALLAGWLASPHGPRKAVVTCRVGDYGGPLRLGELPSVAVRELDENGVRQFAANYLRDRADLFLSRVLPPTDPFRPANPRRMVELVRNPYMLGALLYLFEQSPGGELPANNGALFRSLARALWQREKQRGTAGWRPFEEVESRFAALAFVMIDEGRPVDVPTAYAAENLGDEELLRLGLSASYLQAGDGTVRFYHQLFQEYFAGVKLTAVTDIVPYVTPYEFKIEGWNSGISVGRWDESLVAAAAIGGHRPEFIRKMLHVNPLLAVRGLCGELSVPQMVVGEVVDALWQQLRRDVQRLECDSGQHRQEYLAGGSGMYDDLADLRYHEIAERCEEFGRRVAAVGSAAIPTLIAALADPSPRVRQASLEGLLSVGYGDHGDAVLRVLDDWATGLNASGYERANAEWPLGVPGTGHRTRPLACYAARCLATRGPVENRDVLRGWINHTMRRPGIWNGAADCLAFVGPALVVPLVDVFAGGGDDTRILLAEVIGAIGFVHDLPTTTDAPADVAELVSLAREVLQARYTRDVTQAGRLVDLTAHPQVFVRHYACAALARLFLRRHSAGLDVNHTLAAARYVTPTLRAALMDPSPAVRLAAVEGILLLREPYLLSCLHWVAVVDPDAGVRKEAARFPSQKLLAGS